MRKLSPNLPEVIVSRTDGGSTDQLRSLRKAGLVRKLLPRAYTSNLTDTDEAIVKRNLYTLIGGLFPGSLLSHRTAVEFQPSPEAVVYLTGSNRRKYSWPGIALSFTDGPAPLEDDYWIAEGLHVSSLERACLENLLPSRQRGRERRTVDQLRIEERLLQLLQTAGEDGLNALRDRARSIARQFDWVEAFEKLNTLVSSLLSTRSADVLTSPLARARAFSRPYDTSRVELLQNLYATLRTTPLSELPTKATTDEAYRNFAFFESYFSNYIEGTTFRVDEARQIVFENKIMPLQREDSHDVKGTFDICGNRQEMDQRAGTAEEFFALLKRRHRILMRARPAKLPGQFKINANRAGNTVFVAPGEVLGTLEKGFDLLQQLVAPPARALFVMFLISEVHPFEDGNGRIARLMMNAELSGADQSKIIIPTAYREDYLLNLRRLTRKHDAAAFIRMMVRAQAFSHWLEPESYQQLYTQLQQANAFEEEKILKF